MNKAPEVLATLSDRLAAAEREAADLDSRLRQCNERVKPLRDEIDRLEQAIVK